jgi:hypothetical protein
MKTTRLLIMAGLLLCAAAIRAQDTTLVIDNRRIVIEDDGDRLKVKVFEDNRESQLVFEGHYRDGRNYERRERALYLPLPFWRRSFDPHWAGFGVGFAAVTNGLSMGQMNEIGNGRLITDASLEYNFNFYEKAIRLDKAGNWAVVSGFGMRWTRYRVDGAYYFLNADGYTSLHPVPEGIDFVRSRLNITSLTIPVLLEWQNRRNMFFSAGMVGSIKTMSSSKVTSGNNRGKKETEVMDKGMNLFPVRMEFVVQAGFDWIGAYARYSPMGLFESGKGPKVHPVAIGLQLYF